MDSFYTPLDSEPILSVSHHTWSRPVMWRTATSSLARRVFARSLSTSQPTLQECFPPRRPASPSRMQDGLTLHRCLRFMPGLLSHHLADGAPLIGSSLRCFLPTRTPLNVQMEVTASGVAILRIDCPGEKQNTLSTGMFDEFRDIFERVEKDDAIKAAVTPPPPTQPALPTKRKLRLGGRRSPPMPTLWHTHPYTNAFCKKKRKREREKKRERERQREKLTLSHEGHPCPKTSCRAPSTPPRHPKGPHLGQKGLLDCWRQHQDARVTRVS